MSEAKSELESKISSIIVYQTGVQITQTGTIELNKGAQILTISNLSASLDKESLRVKGKGNARIVNIQIEFNSKKEYKKEQHEQLENQKKALKKKIQRLETEKLRIEEQISKYKSAEDIFYQDFPKSFAFGESEMSKFLEFNEELDKIISKRTIEMEELSYNIEDLKNELTSILNKISNLGPIEEIHNYYEVNINLEVKENTKITIELRYTLNQAWWTPFYDVSLHEKNASLTMMANVYNRTGLDWQEVDVEISTASLKPVNLIKPTPLILSEYIPPRSTSMGGFMNDKPLLKKAARPRLVTAGAGERDGLFLSEEMDEREKKEEAEPMPETTITYAEKTENIGVQSFKIPNKLTILSDKNPHPVNLTVLELNNEKRYFWSNASPENVLIRDKVINGDILLLPGNIKIYYQEEFLGETSIPLVAPKEEFNLGTRITYDLKVDKKIIDRSKDKKAIKGKLKNNYEYQILIKNLNEVEEELIIYDMIPHSNSENIKVEIEEIIPEPHKRKLGILKWKFNMKGIDEKVLKYKYFIEYKKEITISPSLP